MQHGSVALAAESPLDVRKKRFELMLGQIHGDLPWINDGARIVFRLNLEQPETELLGDRFLDGLDGDFARLRVDKVFQYLLGVRERDVGVRERRMRNQPD